MIASTSRNSLLLLLENVSQKAVDTFRARDIYVDHFSDSMSEEQLVRRIGAYHGVGIRSKTRITARVLQSAPKLQFVACFCIGTNQVDVETCSLLGIPVFNSPFSNSRSVAELLVA
ncbi:3-phosphoglycerate dehydrogenase [Moniliophthora roreri MCA 2997]|uniref:3-phosphoglycerate dehydrogenase n=1 Tax=Moniliophthora roreri (strain MCA 2997) TaxID=1381753 RepID=V2XR82_MONRO|nr:3-phosphoglycerate dehydrogenase [Moniliophthora roreri MCA 2997]